MFRLWSATIFVGILWTGLCVQGIPNPGFENWTVRTYEEPRPYVIFNRLSMPEYGVAVVTKTTDAYEGSYAIKLQTDKLDGDTVTGMVSIGNFGEGPGTDPGFIGMIFRSIVRPPEQGYIYLK
ncbi:MAG: hypothetical protein GF350_07505 [Chitinivibrionales bacterium]|nr:hypothetical protein [Chitinivibrionales bacterium]